MAAETQANGTYGNLSRPLAIGVGRSFFLVPASNSFIAAYQAQYPVGDADGQARVVTTPAAAFSLLASGRGDRILVHPGAFTISANIAVTQTNWTMEGIGPVGSAVFTTATADSFTITGDNWRISNVGFVAGATLSNIVLTGATNFIIEDCQFLSTVGGAGTYFIEMVTTANSLGHIRRNRFSADLDVSGGAVTMTAMILGLGNRLEIYDNHLDARRQTTANAGVVSTGVLFAAAADWGNLVYRNTLVEHNGATFTAGIDYGTTVTDAGVIAFDNRFQMGTMANAVVNGSNFAGIGNQAPANGTV